jgi:2-methylisocitrate lyase-like PEP mutase family enzyme
MTTTQTDKATRFRALHAGPGAFVIPNPWDAGSARVLAGLGFQALATSSGASAGVVGRRDGKVTRDEMLAHARAIVAATDLPVSADMEKGFGDAPAVVAETIRLAAAAGLVGGSIEDATGDKARPLYDFAQATERVAAAAEAARALPFAFTLTARAENFLHGIADLKDTLRRLEAYADAGADVLYAPGLTKLDDIAAVVRAVAPRPVNAIMGLAGATTSLAALEQIGVRRVSVGSALARAAYGAFLRAAREIREQGTFRFADDAVPFADINAMFTPPGAG